MEMGVVIGSGHRRLTVPGDTLGLGSVPAGTGLGIVPAGTLTTDMVASAVGPGG